MTASQRSFETLTSSNQMVKIRKKQRELNNRMENLAKKVFDIDGILQHILSFVLGNNLNSLMRDCMSMVNLRLVSTRFNDCFVNYLRSASLEYEYHRDPNKGSIIKWMKAKNIPIRKLKLHVSIKHIDSICENLSGFDFKNLHQLYLMMRFHNNHRSGVGTELIYSLFKEAVALQYLKIDDGTCRCNLNNDYFLSFRNLRTLDISYYRANFEEEIIDGKFLFSGELTLHCNPSIVQFTNLKTMNMIDQHEAIDKLNCPSLERFAHQVCDDDVTIGSTRTSTIEEMFGSTDKSVIAAGTEKLEIDLELVRSVAIVPPDFMESDLFHVPKDCITVFIFMT